MRPLLAVTALAAPPLVAAGPVGVAPIKVGATESAFDLTPRAMFTHKDSELHCPDRELIHPCTTELRGYLKSVDERDDQFRERAYQCAQEVLRTNEDFWVTKNMTHLLLDLDTSKHFFDKDLENEEGSKFFMLGLDFGKKLLAHPECTIEFDTKEELECRCPHLYAKIILLKLKNLNIPKYTQEAQKLFNHLTQEYEWKGKVRQYGPGEAFRWTRMDQTPQIFMPSLEANEVWPESKKKDLPIWSYLEDNFPKILEESMAAYKKADAFRAATNGTGKAEDLNTVGLSAAQKKELESGADLVTDAYRFLFQGGNWDQILLYHGREYTEACEKSFPVTCKQLKKILPDRPQHHMPWTSNQNEQVLVLRLKVGTDTETHCGPANNILNVHLGLKGTKGATLTIAGKDYGWEEGKVIAWDGSFDHKVHCKNCVEDRYIMMVRYMHPGMNEDVYRGNTRTHFEEIPKEWIAKWEKEELREDL